MDDIVKQAMSKWPNVPAVYGWLRLDRRGNWLIKDERVSNPVVTDFIGRNYEHDTGGRWYFQNGPQRVFIALDYTPFVYRVRADANPQALLQLETHTARAVMRLESAWIDDAGIVLLETSHGIGLIDDRELTRLLPCFTNQRDEILSEDAIGDALEHVQGGSKADLSFRYGTQAVPVLSVAAADVPRKFCFVQQPVQPAGEEACR